MYLGFENEKERSSITFGGYDKKYITELGLNTNGIFAEGAVAIGQSLKDKKYLEVFKIIIYQRKF